MRTRTGLAALLALCGCLAAGARAEDEISPERVQAIERRNEELALRNEDLERRVEELEQRDHERARADTARDNDFGDLTDWARRVRISGSVNTGYYHGGQQTPFPDAGFQVFDARLFVDADLGREIDLGDTPIARNIGMTFEWNAVRLGEFQTDKYPSEPPLGEVYVDLQGLGGSHWWNAQLGRFEIPVGENYLLFDKGYRNNPFITNTVGGPWWWNEGIRLYGSDGEDRFGYVASLTNGETDFGTNASGNPQGTLKLYARPTSWLYASVSGLRSGQIGSDSKHEPASGGLWLGETWATPVGSMARFVPVFQDGVPVSGRASNELASTSLVGADLVLTSERFGRLWLGAGRYAMNASQSSRFDRDLDYWIAEWVLQGQALAPELAPFYLALRANGLGTYDNQRGYILDIRQAATFGYNMESLEAYSIALGWHLSRWTTLRGEFTHQVVGLVDGVPQSMRQLAHGANYFGVELGAAF